MSDYELRYVENGLLISASGAWAWFRLPTHSYEVLSENLRLAILFREERLLTGLRDAEGHLLVVPRSHPVSRWADGIARTTTRPAPGWRPYLEELTRHLHGRRFRQREVYLGLRLAGERRQHWLLGLLAGTERLMGLDDPRPHGKLLAALRGELDLTLRRVAAASPGIRLASAAELRWLVWRTSWRGLLEDAEVDEPPARSAWGGEALALVEGVVRNGHRSLRLGDNAGGTAHLSTLAVAHMPDRLAFPGGAEWLHHHDMLDFPIEASIRFRVVSPRQAARDLGRQVAAALDQAEHVARTSADLPLDVQEVYDDARELERRVLRDQRPLLYCWPRLLVAGITEEQLLARVTDLIENYRDLGIELVRPSGDQLSLFLEAMPGDRLRVRIYEQRMEPVTLAGAMYGASAQLGDGRGCYLGQTTGVSREAVAFDVLLAPLVNRPSGVAIVGAPGSGKTTLALLLTYQSRLRGAWAVVIDPKQEATGLARLPGLGRVRIIRLDDTYRGLLDPFRIEDDPAEAGLLAAELCRVFLPARLAQEAEGALLTAADDVAHSSSPSMLGLLDRLVEGNEPGREAAAPLRAMARMPLARMCFAADEVDRLRLDDALTVIQFANLQLPPAGRPPEEWSIPERLGVGLMRAVTALAARLIDAGTARQPKLLMLDEAWALTSSAEGQRLVERMARTGRSKNTALLLVTQNARDLMDERVTNCLSVRFGFRSDDETELRSMLALLDVEPSEDLMAQVSGFADGECLMRDLEGRVGRLQVELVPDELRVAFDTTPRPEREVSGRVE